MCRASVLLQMQTYKHTATKICLKAHRETLAALRKIIRRCLYRAAVDTHTRLHAKHRTNKRNDVKSYRKRHQTSTHKCASANRHKIRLPPHALPQGGRVIHPSDVHHSVTLGQLRLVSRADDDGVRPLRQDLQHRAREGLIAMDWRIAHAGFVGREGERKG